jgi:conjugal transfer pilus assembly protein TraE
MQQDYINNQVIRILKQRNMSLIFGIGMLIANILLSIGILNKQEKVIFLPPEINKSFWVTNKGASVEYLEEMSLFLSGLLLDQTAASSKVKRDILLKYVSPGFYNDLYKRLVDQEKYIAANNISTKFSPQVIEASSKTNKVILTGEMRSFVADKQVSKEQVSYEIKFKYQGAKYLLDGFQKLQKEE